MNVNSGQSDKFSAKLILKKLKNQGYFFDVFRKIFLKNYKFLNLLFYLSKIIKAS